MIGIDLKAHSFEKCPIRKVQLLLCVNNTCLCIRRFVRYYSLSERGGRGREGNGPFGHSRYFACALVGVGTISYLSIHPFIVHPPSNYPSIHSSTHRIGVWYTPTFLTFPTFSFSFSRSPKNLSRFTREEGQDFGRKTKHFFCFQNKVTQENVMGELLMDFLLTSPRFQSMHPKHCDSCSSLQSLYDSATTTLTTSTTTTATTTSSTSSISTTTATRFFSSSCVCMSLSLCSCYLLCMVLSISISSIINLKILGLLLAAALPSVVIMSFLFHVYEKQVTRVQMLFTFFEAVVWMVPLSTFLTFYGLFIERKILVYPEEGACAVSSSRDVDRSIQKTFRYLHTWIHTYTRIHTCIHLFFLLLLLLLVMKKI